MRLLFTLAILLVTNFNPVQTEPSTFIKAITAKGERVLLKPDGTWEHVVDSKEAPHWLGFGEIRTVTLVSPRGPEKTKGSFSFVHGMRDDPGERLTWNKRQLRFDAGPIPNSLEPAYAPNDRSRIKDLGNLTWADLKEIPQLPALPEPARERPLAAVVGHIYELHSKSDDVDLYALFRVEDLKSRDTCTISWIVVPSPERRSTASGAYTYSGQAVLIESDGAWLPVFEPVDGKKWKGGTELRLGTLLSRRMYNDWEKATFTFLHDVRDFPGRKTSSRRLDLLYGQGDEDAFGTVYSELCQSRIKNLGRLMWAELDRVAPLPAYEVPTEQVRVPAVPGNIYQIRVKSEYADFQALFRVEWLEPGKLCVISWTVLPEDKK